jgi:hypothetical protein
MLPNSGDDSDPLTLDVLYVLAVAFKLDGQLARARALLERFLQHAPADGHRKVCEAHYQLGGLYFNDLSDGGRGSVNKPEAAFDRIKRAAETQLALGIAAQQRLPAFLRYDKSFVSPNRESLELFLRLMEGLSLSKQSSLEKQAAAAASTVHVSSSSSPPPPSLVQEGWRGGEILSGPKRHGRLRCDTPYLLSRWRIDAAGTWQYVTSIERQRQVLIANTINPTRCSVGLTSLVPLRPATVDELLSCMRDQVHTGRSLECIVVTLPYFTGASHQLIVEDSCREPARLAVYNLNTASLSRLLPGCKIQLMHPYVRFAQDNTIMLRVDNPDETMRVADDARHELCWSCLRGGAAVELMTCGRCAVARYCSKACQQTDWRQYGHKYACAVVKSRVCEQR